VILREDSGIQSVTKKCCLKCEGERVTMTWNHSLAAVFLFLKGDADIIIREKCAKDLRDFH